MTEYSDALAYLYGLQSRGVKLGLRNTRALMRAAGNPHRQFLSIHIAGTNGKGSTAAFLASVFTAAGYRTGLYTSPHLQRFTERIAIDGEEVPESVVAQHARKVQPIVERLHATFFEATTCIAFQYFAERHIDIGIIETGLGGRLDATNIMRPLATVITDISMDHTRELGKTIASIAREKGGIMKRGVPCVTSVRHPAALRVLYNTARNKGVGLSEARSVVSLAIEGMSTGYARVNLESGRLRIRNQRLGLAGYHQATNARLAVAALEILLRSSRFRSRFPGISTETVARGLRLVGSNTGLSGRLQVSGTGRRYIFDVAHNPSGMQTLVRSLASVSRTPRVAVFGVMRDKEYLSMLDALCRVSTAIVLVAPDMERAANPHDLVLQCRSRGIPAVEGGSVRAGIAKAEGLAGPTRNILVTGSHYVVGDALAALVGRGLDKRGRNAYI